MKTLACVSMISMSLLFIGCARHFVVERDFGRVDSTRSISTNSDGQWTVRTEPDANEDSLR